MFKTSIRTKITFITFFVILVTGIGTLFVIQSTLRESYALALEERGIAETKHLALSAIEDILTVDKQTLQSLVDEKKRSSSDILYVFILDESNNILAHTFPEGFPFHLLWANEVKEGQETNIATIKYENTPVFDFAVKIIFDNEVIGLARLATSQKSIDEPISQINFLSTVTILFILVIGVIISIVLNNFIIINPIRILHDSTEEINQTGNLDYTINLKTGDELEQLADSFNRMVTGLKIAYDKIEVLNKGVLENIFDAIAVIDLKGKITLVNDSFTSLSGYSHEQMIGLELSMFILKEVNEFVLDSVMKGKRVINLETVLIQENEERVPIALFAVLIQEYEIILLVVRDLRVEKELTEERTLFRRFALSHIYAILFKIGKNGLEIIISDDIPLTSENDSKKKFLLKTGEFYYTAIEEERHKRTGLFGPMKLANIPKHIGIGYSFIIDDNYYVLGFFMSETLISLFAQRKRIIHILQRNCQFGEQSELTIDFLDLVKHQILELEHEEPIMLLIFGEKNGLTVFTKTFTEDITAQFIIGGFLSAINAFSREAFSTEGIVEEIKHEEYIMLMALEESLVFAYVYKGKSKAVLRKLKKFIASLKEHKELWKEISSNVPNLPTGAKKQVIEDLIDEYF